MNTYCNPQLYDLQNSILQRMQSDREIRKPFNPFIKVLEVPISRKQSETGTIKME